MWIKDWKSLRKCAVNIKAVTNATSAGLSNRPSNLWRALSHALRQILTGPLLSWLSPNVSVKLTDAKGDVSFWVGDGHLFRRDASRPTATQYVAVEVPDSLLLWRSIDVPSLSSIEIQEALSLEARAVSPFMSEDLVWGYGAPGRVRGSSTVSLCMASRKQIEQHLQALSSTDSKPPLMWAMQREGAPVVLPGAGDGVIREIVGRQRRANFVLLVMVFILGGCLALTPTVQQRFRAVEATAAFDMLREKTRDELKKKETLHRLGESIKALQELTGDSVNALPVLSHMTDLLSDETSLFSISVQGAKVSLYGQTPNAASLMQRLSSEPGLKEVKAPVPAARANASTKDNFTIDFYLGSVSPSPALGVSGPVPVAQAAASVPVAGAKP